MWTNLAASYDAFSSALLYKFPEPPVVDIIQYVEMGSQGAVIFPERVIVILNCLPFAMNMYGKDVNLSTIQWFRIATKTPERPGDEREIVDNTSSARVFLSANKERLLIQELRIATGSEVGTEAAYRCEVCQNVPPNPRNCSATTTIINAHGE